MADWIIFGAGYIGTRLARALLADGETVVACRRDVDKIADLAAAGATVRPLKASHPRAFGYALADHKRPVVVYAIPPIEGFPAGEIIQHATEAARRVGAHRFIYLSSIAVYGEARPSDPPVDEDTATVLSDPIGRTYIGEETSVQTASLSGLNTVTLRLSPVYGPGRGVRKRLEAGTYNVIDEGVHIYSRIHVDDLVGIIRAAVARAPAGALYCVADDKPASQGEYARWLAERLGVPPPVSVPSIAPGVKRHPIRNRAVSNARLKRELDYQFRYPTYVEGETAIDAESEGAAPPSTTPATATRPAPTPAAPPPARVVPAAELSAGARLAGAKVATRHLDSNATAKLDGPGWVYVVSGAASVGDAGVEAGDAVDVPRGGCELVAGDEGCQAIVVTGG